MSSEREKKGNIFYEQEQGVMEEQDFSELSCHTVPEISGEGGVLERLYSWLVLVLFTPIFVAHVFDFL